MIPYIDLGPWQLGPFTVHPFGIMVGLAIIVGVTVTQRYAERKNLSVQVISEALIWCLIVAFVMAHLVSVIFYFPERIVKDPLELIYIWKGLSSFGGFVGGTLGLYFYLRFRAKVDPWPYMDSVAYGLAFGWIFGRTGCTFAHDHPGKMTDFWFSVQYPAVTQGARPELAAAVEGVPQFANADVNNALNTGLPYVGRFDLGFYEMIFTLILSSFLFITNRDGKRWSGYNVAMLALLYAPVRFFFDFLRVQDKHYLGLTPGHYFAFSLLFLGTFLVIWRRRLDGKPPSYLEAAPATASTGKGSTSDKSDAAGGATSGKRKKKTGKRSGKAKKKKKG